MSLKDEIQAVCLCFTSCVTSTMWHSLLFLCIETAWAHIHCNKFKSNHIVLFQNKPLFWFDTHPKLFFYKCLWYINHTIMITACYVENTFWFWGVRAHDLERSFFFWCTDNYQCRGKKFTAYVKHDSGSISFTQMEIDT